MKKKMDQELVEENQRLKAERETQRREDQLTDSLSELQVEQTEWRDTLTHSHGKLSRTLVMYEYRLVLSFQKLKEETANYAEEAERWKVERNTLQNQTEQLEKHLQVAKQEVQVRLVSYGADFY